MKLPANYKRSIEAGVVTPEIAADVIYSFNKRAKNMRDKQFSYRNHRILYCGYRNGFHVTDKYDNEAAYREKKEEYYDKKERMLSFFTPLCIHVVGRIRRANYDFWEEDDDCDNNRDWYSYKEYYLFYEFGGHSFHTPIDEPNKYRGLDIIELERLETSGEDIDKLLSVQFCDKVLRGLISGSLTIVEHE